MEKLYLVIPVLNEARNMPILVEDLRTLRSRISPELDLRPIIVDDGSTDGTLERIRESGGDLCITELRHERNLGPGAAFSTAFRYLRLELQTGDWVVTMEGDNTSRLDTLVHMLKRRHEGYDVVLASVYAYGGGIKGVERKRVVLSHCANALAKMLLGLRGLHTLSSFFRLYSGATIQRLQDQYGAGIIRFTGFECMVELLLKLVLLGAKISEVEMELDWSKRKGQSKMRIFRAMMGYSGLLFAGWRWRLQANKSFWVPVRKS